MLNLNCVLNEKHNHIPLVLSHSPAPGHGSRTHATGPLRCVNLQQVLSVRLPVDELYRVENKPPRKSHRTVLGAYWFFGVMKYNNAPFPKQTISIPSVSHREQQRKNEQHKQRLSPNATEPACATQGP